MRFLAAFALVGLVAAGVGFYYFGASATRVQEYTMAYEPGAHFDIDTKNGAIEVVVDHDVKDVVIEATFKARGSSEEDAKNRLESFDVDLTSDEKGVFRLRPIFPRDRSSTDACSFVIRTPGGGIGKINTSNGDISVKGLMGPAEVETSNGDITVVGSEAGDMKLKTSNGDVTVSGAAGKVVIDTSNGDIELALTAEARGGFKLDTSNGNIDVDMPEAIGGSLSAKTSNGRVSFLNEKKGHSVNAKRKKCSMVLTEDGPESTAKSSNGSITINIR